MDPHPRPSGLWPVLRDAAAAVALGLVLGALVAAGLDGVLEPASQPPAAISATGAPR